MSKQLTADKPAERLFNGLIKENPTFVLMLGMCPTLAVTTSAINGLGMGLTTTAVLMLSNLIISSMRKIIPGRVRIPAFIVIIASFVTVLELLLEAYIPFLNKALGMYIPLIVVNCIILGRAESYASSHGPIASLFDGLGMGLGFSLALTCIGAVREILGSGSVFNMEIPGFTPIRIFGQAPGAFFVLAALSALQNIIKKRSKNKSKKDVLPEGCGQNCSACEVSGCSSHGKFYDIEAVDKTIEEVAEKPAEKQPEKQLEKKEEKQPEKQQPEKQEEKQPEKQSEKHEEKSVKKPVKKSSKKKGKKRAAKTSGKSAEKNAEESLTIIELEEEDE